MYTVDQKSHEKVFENSCYCLFPDVRNLCWTDALADRADGKQKTKHKAIDQALGFIV